MMYMFIKGVMNGYGQDRKKGWFVSPEYTQISIISITELSHGTNYRKFAASIPDNTLIIRKKLILK